MNFRKLLNRWRVVMLLVVLGLSVYNLKPWTGSLDVEMGFDIQGGSRIILRPSNQSVPLPEIIDVITNRLNVYGLSDIRIRGTTDLQSNLIVVEAAGLTEQDIQDLLASQGHFEAKIANVTVFTGEDVRVDKTGIQLRQDTQTGGYAYSIPIMLSPEAARRFAEVTRGLFPSTGGDYLDETLDLYIDGKELQSLQIAADLRGREVPSASVTGGAETLREAANKKDKMVAILMTGSIPTKLEVESIQQVSPVLGGEFLMSTVAAGLVAALLVGLVLYVRYRNPDIVGSILFMSLSELLITLAIASFFKNYWQFDLSALAGLVIAIGTGVDQEIIMTDSVLLGGGGRSNHKEAMFVIMASFGTIAAAMSPLLTIGAGAVKGFAITTLIGIAVGYLVTRPSYLTILEEIAA